MRARAIRSRGWVEFMGGEYASLTNPEKGRSDKSKTKDKNHLKYALTVTTNAWVHGPKITLKPGL